MHGSLPRSSRCCLCRAGSHQASAADAMSLCVLPPELTQVVTAFLTLVDVVVLVGCAAPHDASTRLHHFLPSAEALEGFVANAKRRVKSERRKYPSKAAEGAVSGYEDECVRRLLLNHDYYAGLAPVKLDATEALRLGLSSVAVEILQAQRRRRQLNRFSLAKTLALALRRSDHAVMGWICNEGVHRLPRGSLQDVLLACCEYQEQDNGIDKGTELMMSLLHGATSTDLHRLLVASARCGKPAIVDHLLRELISDSRLRATRTSTFEDAMAAAAEGATTEILLALVDVVSSIPGPQPLNASAALVRACERGCTDIVSTLLNCALVTFPSNTKGSSGRSDTPLFAAVKGGSREVLEMILSDRRVSQWDPRAFQEAASSGQLAVVQDLIRHPECRPKDVEMALRAAAVAKRCPHSVDHTTTTNILLGLLTRLQVDSGSSWELLDLVSSYGNVELIELLLTKFPSSDQCSDRKYWRPLVTAARHGHADVIRLVLQGDGVWKLLSIEQSLDAESEYAEALLGACHRGHLEAAKLLLPHVSLEMMQLLRIVEAAAAAPTCTVLQWLLGTEKIITQHGTATGYDLDAALQYACAHGRAESARLLLAHPQVRFENGLPIQFAATSGELALVELLLGDPRVTEAYDLEGALIDASREGHALVVARLLADTRLRITSGAAFHEAAHYGKRDVLEMLLRQPELDPDSLDLEAAYLRASHRGHYAIVFLFLNDPRVRLPRNGAITRIEDLPKRAGDTMWCRRFLRRFFRHPRVDPTADDHQLLLDACLQARLGVVDALLRSGRVAVTETLVETVEALALLSEQANRPREGGGATRDQQRRQRRYKALAATLHQCKTRYDKSAKLLQTSMELLIAGTE